MDESFREELEQLAEEEYMSHLRKFPEISDGEAALDAILIYQSFCLPVPENFINEIARCWRLFKDGFDITAPISLDSEGYPSVLGGDAVPYQIVDGKIFIDEKDRKKIKSTTGVKYCKSLDDAFGIKRKTRPKKKTFENNFLTIFICKRLKTLHRAGFVFRKDSDKKDLSNNAYAKVRDELNAKYSLMIDIGMVSKLKEQYEKIRGKTLLEEIKEEDLFKKELKHNV